MRILGLLLMAALMLAPGARAASARHRITYLTSTTAYIDAGRDEGVVGGARIEVVRDGVVIAVLRVTDLSSHRAACAIESATVPLEVGAAVRFDAVPVPARPAAGSVAVPDSVPPVAESVVAAPAESWMRRMGLRGRVGARYLSVIDQSGFGGDVSQPSIDLRVDGRNVGGSPFDLQVDVRARHTFQTVADGREFDDGEARVYRLNGTWRPSQDRIRVTMGRQFSSALTSVSTFDGVQAEYDRPRWGAGAFAGTQPGPVDYSFSTDVREYGGFARVRSAPRAGVRWEGIVAAIGSYEQGQINREYVSLVGRLATPRLSLTAQQDIDIYRGWRGEAESSGSSFTSTFLIGRYRLRPTIDLDAGYDNRRDVRVYRDYVSPETEFDDSYRQGVWGGAGVRFAGRYRAGISARSSGGGSSGDAMSYIGTFSASRVTPAHLDFRLRSTRYENDRSDGWMHSASGGIQVGPRWALELYGGVRDDRGKTPSIPDTEASWFGANVDVGVSQSLYLNLSGEHNGSGEEGYHQIYTSLSWRF
jgi:hypothetical protein